MCGIAGIFDTQGKAPPEEALLNAMNQVQYRRGPDEGSIYLDEKVGLAHRRLSIIDIAGGQQPLFNSSRSAAIVFNGEIYNYQLLRRELIKLGHAFLTHSDTEVIVQAWCEWGEKCVDKLRGMFAFAIWDFKQQKMFIARDRLGIKPFFYSLLDNGQFIFGSELKVLEQHPQMRRGMDKYTHTHTHIHAGRDRGRKYREGKVP